MGETLDVNKNSHEVTYGENPQKKDPTLQKTADSANDESYVGLKKFNNLDMAGAMARRLGKV